MAVQDQITAHPTVFVDTFTDGLLGPDVEMLGPVADGGHIVWNSTPGLLGADDHARDPRRARGLPPGRGRGRRGRRRDRDPDQGHRGHVERDVVGQRPADGGPLQRRPVLRAGLRRLRDRVAGDAARGHRPGGGPLRQLRRGRHPVHVHQRLHDRVRRAPPRRRDAARRAGRGARARRRPRRRAARALGAEPDPDVRAARHRRARHAAAPVPRPARHVAVATIPDSHNAGDFGAFLVGAPHRYAMDAAGAAAAQDRRAPRHRRGARRRDPRLPGQAARRRRLPRRHARAAGRRRDRGPHRRRVRHGHAPGRGGRRPRRSTGRCCSRSPRTCRSSPGR